MSEITWDRCCSYHTLQIAVDGSICQLISLLKNVDAVWRDEVAFDTNDEVVLHHKTLEKYDSSDLI